MKNLCPRSTNMISMGDLKLCRTSNKVSETKNNFGKSVQLNWYKKVDIIRSSSAPKSQHLRNQLNLVIKYHNPVSKTYVTNVTLPIRQKTMLAKKFGNFSNENIAYVLGSESIKNSTVTTPDLRLIGL